MGTSWMPPCSQTKKTAERQGSAVSDKILVRSVDSALPVVAFPLAFILIVVVKAKFVAFLAFLAFLFGGV